VVTEPVSTPAVAEVPASPAEPSQAGNWYDGLPETVRAWDEVKNASDADGFYKQMGDMRSMIGRSVQVPGEDASTEARTKFVEKMLGKTPEVMLKPTDENMDTFYNSLGRPAESSEYKLPTMENDALMDEASVDAFRPAAHALGLTQKQFEGIVAKMTENSVSRNEQVQADHKEGMTALNGEWGLATEQNMKMADMVRAKFFPHMTLPIAQMDVNSIKSLHALGQALGTESPHMTQESGVNVAMTPAEAEATINEIMSNQEHAYWNQAHPGHKAAKERVIKLHEYKLGQAS